MSVIDLNPQRESTFLRVRLRFAEGDASKLRTRLRLLEDDADHLRDRLRLMEHEMAKLREDFSQASLSGLHAT